MGRSSRARQQRRIAPIGRLEGIVRAERLTAAEVAAGVVRAGKGDVVAQVKQIPVLQTQLEARKRELVDQARELGVQWAVIGKALGVSAQAVQQRYGRAGG